MGQPLTVNLWVYPAPAGPNFEWYGEAFDDVTVTFTRPDGTTDTFLPVDGSGGLPAGTTEMIGAIWFYYTPDQVGTWSASFSFPGQTFTYAGYTVYYTPCTSPTTTFEVQQDAVQIGLPPVELPGPNQYWERPINADNREWSQISGAWRHAQYDASYSSFNPYSTAPNSPHILWKRQVSAGGIVGGEWGSMSYADGGGSPPVIMMGRVYYNMPGGVFHCVDLRTGELLWEKPGSITLGQHIRPTTRDPTRGTPETQSTTAVPYLWGLGSSWIRYDALTGAVVQTIENVDRPARHSFGSSGNFGTTWFEADPVVFVVRQSGWNTTIPSRLAENELIRWNREKVTGNDWMTGIEWRVSLKNPDGTGPGEGARSSYLKVSPDRTVGAVATTGQDDYYGYDLTTGAQLWANKVDHFRMLSTNALMVSPEGIFVSGDSVTLKFYGYDVKTGNELWESDPIGEYPWGSSEITYGAAYGNIHIQSYDGYIYSVDYTTGKLNWKFHAGDTTETAFGNWAPYIRPCIADGKVYIATTEHTPTQPRIRGNMLFCLDAYTGAHIWNISGFASSQGFIAEGTLMRVNENDGCMYAFSKGKTETTVDAPLTAVPKGTGVVIRGSVLDMSPAQAGTPAIADEDMGGWMSYMHMQKPMPMDVTGVPVKLLVVHPDGNVEWIYTRTTDMYGHFEHMYIPPTEGTYKILACFDGSESYWPSVAETAIAVQPGSSAAQQFAWQESAETSLITTEVAIIAAVAVAVVIGIVSYWMLREKT
jgi:outer membrane protein assembly factor BamB